MRKLLWCCSAAALLTAGGFLSLTYYACRHPDSMLGRGMFAIAEASISMQPMSGLVSLVARTNPPNAPEQEAGGLAEECVPEDPRPIALEEEKIPNALVKPIEPKEEIEFAEIRVPEEDVPPGERVVQAVPATIDMEGVQELPASLCPIVMPSCQEGEEQSMTPPRMPYADEEVEKPIHSAKKPDQSHEESETGVFEAWKKALESGEEKSFTVEVLPAPTEEDEPQDEPKCEEDIHRHEQYPGCPRVTCPYTGKSYPMNVPSKNAGKEESSEEPMEHLQKPQSHKGVKSDDDAPHAAGVDTMEFRKSDAGLNEYGPGPVH